MSVCYQKVLCYKVCATKRYILGGRKNIVHYFALWLTIGAEGVICKLTKNVRPQMAFTKMGPSLFGECILSQPLFALQKPPKDYEKSFGGGSVLLRYKFKI